MWGSLAGFDKSGLEQALTPLKEEAAQSTEAKGGGDARPANPISDNGNREENNSCGCCVLWHGGPLRMPARNWLQGPGEAVSAVGNMVLLALSHLQPHGQSLSPTHVCVMASVSCSVYSPAIFT